MLTLRESKTVGREWAEELWHAFVETGEAKPLRLKWDDVYGLTVALQMEADPAAFNEAAAKTWGKFQRQRAREDMTDEG
jgi:hypothetical protein